MILNQYLNAKFNKKFPDTFEDLKKQLLLADKYIFPLWFHFDLIIITFLFFIIIFIFRKHSLFILQLLLLLSYIIQYSKYDFNNFFRKNPYYNVYSIRLIPSSIPFTIVGYILGYYNFLDIIQKHKIKTFVLSYLIYNIIADYKIFTNISDVRFSEYSGIYRNIQSICLVSIFSLFSSYLVKNNIIKKFLIFITNYTGGIYYLHVPLKMYLKDYSDDIKNLTFLGCIKTYIIIYCICFFGMLIFGKTPFKYLFY